MKKLSLSLILVLGLPVTLAALQEAKPKAVLVEPIQDLGTVPKGNKDSAEYLIKNEGTAPLEIWEVKTTCACTVVDYDEVIPPGETGKVTAVLDTASQFGAVAKSIGLFTNDEENPVLRLTLKAVVEPYIYVEPGYVRYIAYQGFEKDSTVVQTLWAADGNDFEILDVEAPHDFIDVSFREATEEEELPQAQGRQWRVATKLSPEAPVGALTGYLEVRTNHEKQKLVHIPVSGFMRPLFAVTPTEANFGTVEAAEDFEPRSLFVKNFGEEEVELTKVETDVEGIEGKIETRSEGREFFVFLSFQPDVPKGPFDGTVRIHTTSSKKPVVEVPVKGEVL